MFAVIEIAVMVEEPQQEIRDTNHVLVKDWQLVSLGQEMRAETGGSQVYICVGEELLDRVEDRAGDLLQVGYHQHGQGVVTHPHAALPPHQAVHPSPVPHHHYKRTNTRVTQAAELDELRVPQAGLVSKRKVTFDTG